jgi:hypothetical protein
MYDLSLPHRAYSLPISASLVDWSSFPSDNAAYFSALTFGLVHLLRRYSVRIWLYTAAWICLPRMFLGVHYLSDMAVGAPIGIATVKVALKFSWLQQNPATAVLRFMETKPHVFYAAAFLVFFEMGLGFVDVRGAAKELFHALQPAHFRQLLRTIPAGLGSFGVVLMAASMMFFIVKWPYRRLIIQFRYGRRQWLQDHRGQHPASETILLRSSHKS